jgi:HAD superfamily hydrolase (TIGR01484 family)
MKTIKLIVSDIDGTLVDSHGQVLPATITGVQAAVAKGAKMVLASARSPKGMFGIAQQLGINSTMIAYNGALTATTDANDQLTVFEERAVVPSIFIRIMTGWWPAWISGSNKKLTASAINHTWLTLPTGYKWRQRQCTKL